MLKRRRSIETAALTARTLAIVLTILTALGLKAGMVATLNAGMQAGCWGAIAAMMLANLLAYHARRRPDSRWYRQFSGCQVLLDTATILGVVVLATRSAADTAWPFLDLAIAVGALRLQLRGAMLVFAGTSLGFALLVPGTAELPVLVGVGLLIAVITGTQSTSLEKHLAELSRTRAALHHQATHDWLTGLPNRAHLTAYAETLADRALAVLLLDLNGFKQVNDTYGHAAGDQLLRTVGDRLAATLPGPGMAGRLGGDEFLVLVPDVDGVSAASIAQRMRDEIARPIDIGGGRQSTVGVSIGTALRPAGADTDLDALTSTADAGMYVNKQRHHREALEIPGVTAGPAVPPAPHASLQ